MITDTEINSLLDEFEAEQEDTDDWLDIDPDTASREQLVKAFKALSDEFNWQIKRRKDTLRPLGLDFFTTGDGPDGMEFGIVNREKAVAWFEKALLEFE